MAAAFDPSVFQNTAFEVVGAGVGASRAFEPTAFLSTAFDTGAAAGIGPSRAFDGCAFVATAFDVMPGVTPPIADGWVPVTEPTDTWVLWAA